MSVIRDADGVEIRVALALPVFPLGAGNARGTRHWKASATQCPARNHTPRRSKSKPPAASWRPAETIGRNGKTSWANFGGAGQPVEKVAGAMLTLA